MSNKTLVVDDNFYNRALVRLALEYTDYTVAEAENGLEALQMLARDTYDLLILDLVMPELGGIGVLAEIRQSTRHSPMKIIVVTAHPELATDIWAEVDYVMCKPIDIQMLKTFLRYLKSPEAVR